MLQHLTDCLASNPLKRSKGFKIPDLIAQQHTVKEIVLQKLRVRQKGFSFMCSSFSNCSIKAVSCLFNSCTRQVKIHLFVSNFCPGMSALSAYLSSSSLSGSSCKQFQRITKEYKCIILKIVSQKFPLFINLKIFKLARFYHNFCFFSFC